MISSNAMSSSLALESQPPPGADGDAAMETASRVAAQIVENVGRVLEGKTDAIALAVTALLAQGHLLIEDVPGVGKTTLARLLARSVNVDFGRVQFTSDLMPADVLGGSVFDQASGRFEFRPGPIFTNVLLADEINRTTPKTQSALLEAMEERQVSVDGISRSLDDPFFVVATQNPGDFYGTYPLPESQLDRFLLRLRLGYPEPEVERDLLRRRTGRADVTVRVGSVVDRPALKAAQAALRWVRVDDTLVEYLHRIVIATRNAPRLELGVSTRGALSFERAVRSHALVRGRTYAIPDDVRALSVPVLAHRVRVTGQRDSTAVQDAERVIDSLLERIDIPL